MYKKCRDVCVEFEVITSIKIGLSHSCKKETCIYRTFIGHSQKSPEQKYLPESTAGKDYISLTRNGNQKFRLNFQNFKQNLRTYFTAIHIGQLSYA